MRSTNSSISRSTTSGARRRRCRASSPGCARRETEVKRDMEIARDEVRVMTVHGAKGLEAPIVILADTTTPPAGPRPPRCSARSRLAAAAARRARLVWAGRKADDCRGRGCARERVEREAEDEYRRLLYVAMTRAIERLVVCGCARRASAMPRRLLVRPGHAALRTPSADRSHGRRRRRHGAGAIASPPPATPACRQADRQCGDDADRCRTG